MQNYSALAPLYDRIMAHVEYDKWVSYIKQIIASHGQTQDMRILEIGGGTGILGAMLLRQGLNYVGSDLSVAMCGLARKKGAPFFAADARFIPIKRKEFFDLVIFLYDGINYLQSINDYDKTFKEVYSFLKPHGLFLFDVTTTANSLKNFNEFVDSGDFGDHFFFRRSYFSLSEIVQYNDFTIFSKYPNGPGPGCGGNFYQKFMEHHGQKVFPVSCIRNAVPQDLFNTIGMWDNFSFKRCSSRSERVHFLLRKRPAS
jgi:ubiquinone/menaquinone biosynthesis C-methylase UbiE